MPAVPPDALRRCRPGLGTFVEVAILDGGGSGDAMRAVEAAFAAVARVEALMSFHDPASDLSRINARAHREEIAVDAWTFDVLSIARDLHRASAGHFDCTIAPLLIERGLLPSAGPVQPDPDASFDDVSLDEGRVRFRRALAIDLGGIAKGYAVDRAVDALRRHGVESAVVNAGGDLRVLGSTPLPIHVRPLDDGPSPERAGMLADGAFATSACYHAGTRQAPSALVDPFARSLVDRPLRYSVIAPTCAVADGLTKALASAGRLSRDCLRAFDAHALVH